jgi:enoyl-CoA hydratase/carnithine racemase
MTAEEAKAYGLVDEVVKSRKDIPAEITHDKIVEKMDEA